ncbi:hypothetical protein [Brevibacterium casei]|jgi:hypothetical protein|uniref:hypothetical protein n=1 Tax=Brevibacterium casei TaxID=33889 RepID=UPI001643BEC2|nr:hypothetical protein [Brevibacterium casei]
MTIAIAFKTARNFLAGRQSTNAQRTPPYWLRAGHDPHPYRPSATAIVHGARALR